MQKFKEWFEKKLIVARFPSAEDFVNTYATVEAVINVSDEMWPWPMIDKLRYGGNKMLFWFPMNESKRDIGLNSIYGAMQVLYECEQRGVGVLLHCHAGANRSPTVQQAYYYMRTGMQLPSFFNKRYMNQLTANCYRGYLPPLAEMEEFLHKCGEAFASKERYLGGMLDWCKIGSINNF